MKKILVTLSFFFLGFFLLLSSNAVALTKEDDARAVLSVRNGRLRVETARNRKTVGAGENAFVDRRGRLRFFGHVPQRLAPVRHFSSALVVVTKGRLLLNKSLVLTEPQMILLPLDTEPRPVSPRFILDWKRFLGTTVEETPWRQAVVGRDIRGRIHHEISLAAESLRRKNIRAAASIASPAARFGPLDREALAARIADLLRDNEVHSLEWILTDFLREPNGSVSCRILVAAEIAPTFLPFATTSVAASGILDFRERDGRWQIESGNVTALDVQGNTLFRRFVDFRREILGR
ncbi:MAG: hypothetical protein D6679_11210 [Candidatus Hydrogenedentota bacterium]|nr:MAG: hypothetical protein D6679_11210 [Candidatus Hydrogenedentota bacterium]